MGALTREARAEERVAEKVPAMMRGPNPDAMVITWTTGIRSERLTLKRGQWRCKWSLYLEVVHQAKFTGLCFTGGKVITEFTGGHSRTVAGNARNDEVRGVSCGVSDNSSS